MNMQPAFIKDGLVREFNADKLHVLGIRKPRPSRALSRRHRRRSHAAGYPGQGNGQDGVRIGHVAGGFSQVSG